MDPAIGASTWAFGSQRCKPYKGIFTINAIRQANHQIWLVAMFGLICLISHVLVSESVAVSFCNDRIAINSGSDPIKV